MAAEWINRRREKLEQDSQDAAVEAAKERLTALTIRADVPLFWNSLLPELNEQCGDLEGIGFQGQAYSLDNPFCPDEKTIRISVQSKGNWPVDAHASLIHFTGSSLIQVSSNIPKLTEISLCVTERGIMAVSNKELRQMDLKALAAYLLEGLVEAIDKERKA